jgi:hypothetical protein
MKARLLIPLLAPMAVGLFACAEQTSDGRACFQSSECKSGSVCAATVYGNFCMRQCSEDVVRCDKAEACLRASDLGAGGAGGAAGVGGTGGIGGEGGVGGAGEEDIWVCLPGALNIQSSEIIPRVTGSPCDYSIECMVGGVCVYNPVGMCSGQGMEGPTCCAELCNPDIINQCPGDFVCIDLGTGRGFCGPSTFEEN